MRRLFFSGVSLIALIVLSACEMQGSFSSTPAPSIAEIADLERGKRIATTRSASYAVYPDLPDPTQLSDPTIVDAMRARTTSGSAFAVRADGLILTNWHLVERTMRCVVGNDSADDPRERDVLKQEVLARISQAKPTWCFVMDQERTRVHRAKLVAYNEEHDTASLCLSDPPTPLPILGIASPEEIHVGAEIFTIGAPLGQENVFTMGYVGNTNHIMEDRETGKKSVPLIQITAPILPGNSGGPLVSTATGKVVGQVVAVSGGMAQGTFTHISFGNRVHELHDLIRKSPPCTP